MESGLGADSGRNEAPAGFPDRGLVSQRAGHDPPRVADAYISTVSATSVKAGIWSKFM